MSHSSRVWQPRAGSHIKSKMRFYYNTYHLPSIAELWLPGTEDLPSVSTYPSTSGTKHFALYRQILLLLSASAPISYRRLMATFVGLPTEILVVIMSQVSFRDRAHMALVSRRCKDIADDEECYKIQYMRDFGKPTSHVLYTGSSIREEVSWKTAYERRHFADMPLLVQDRLSSRA